MLKTDPTPEINPANPTTGNRGSRQPRSTDTFAQRLRRFKRATGQSVPCPSVRNIGRKPPGRREDNSSQTLKELKSESDNGSEIAAVRRLLQETRSYDNLSDSTLAHRNRLQASLNKRRLLDTLALAQKEKLQAVKGYTLSSNGVLVVSENTQNYSEEGAVGGFPALCVQSVDFIRVEARAGYRSEKLLAGSKTCADSSSSDTGGPGVRSSGAGVGCHRTQCVEGGVDQCVSSRVPGCGATGPGNRDDQALKPRTEQRGSTRMLQSSFTDEVSTNEPGMEFEVDTHRFGSFGLLDNAEFYENSPGEYDDEIYFYKDPETPETGTDKDEPDSKCNQNFGVRSMFTEIEPQNEKIPEDFFQVGTKTPQNKVVRSRDMCQNNPSLKLGPQDRFWPEIAGTGETDLRMDQSKTSFVFLEGHDQLLDSKQHRGATLPHGPIKRRSLESSPAGSVNDTAEQNSGHNSEKPTGIHTSIENLQQQSYQSAGDLVSESLGEDRKVGNSSKFDLLTTNHVSKSSILTTCYSTTSDEVMCHSEDQKAPRTGFLCFDNDEESDRIKQKSSTKILKDLPAEEQADMKLEVANEKTMPLSTTVILDLHQGFESPDRAMGTNSILLSSKAINTGLVNCDVLNVIEVRENTGATQKHEEVNTENWPNREEAITQATLKQEEDSANKETVHRDKDTDATPVHTQISKDVAQMCENDSSEITQKHKKEIEGVTRIIIEENTDDTRILGEDNYEVTQMPEEENRGVTQITDGDCSEATQIFEEENSGATQDDTTGVTQIYQGFSTEIEQIQKEEFTEATKISKEGYFETTQVNAEEITEVSQMHKQNHAKMLKVYNAGNRPGPKEQVAEDEMHRRDAFKSVGLQEDNYDRIKLNKVGNKDDQIDSTIEVGKSIDAIQINSIDNMTRDNESKLIETPLSELMHLSAVHPSHKMQSKKDRNRSVKKKSEATEDLASQLVMYQSRKLVGMTENTGPSPFRTFEAYHRQLLERVLQPSPCFSEVDCPVVSDDDGEEEEEEFNHHTDGDTSEESYQGRKSRGNSFTDKADSEDLEIHTNQLGGEVMGSIDVFGNKQFCAEQLQEVNHIIGHHLFVDPADESEPVEGLDRCLASLNGKNMTLGSRDQSHVDVQHHQSIDVTPADKCPNVYLRGFNSPPHAPCFHQAADVTTTISPYIEPVEYCGTEEVSQLHMTKDEVYNNKSTLKRKAKQDSHSSIIDKTTNSSDLTCASLSREMLGSEKVTEVKVETPLAYSLDEESIGYNISEDFDSSIPGNNINIGSKIMELSRIASDSTDDTMTANPRLTEQSESALDEQLVSFDHDNEGTQSSISGVISHQSDAALREQYSQGHCKITKNPSAEVGAGHSSATSDVVRSIASPAPHRGCSEGESDGQRKLLVNDKVAKRITEERRRMVNFEKIFKDKGETDLFLQDNRYLLEANEKVSPMSKPPASPMTYHDLLQSSVCLASELTLNGQDGTANCQTSWCDLKQEESNKSLYNGIAGTHTNSPLLLSPRAGPIPEPVLSDTLSESKSRSHSVSQGHTKYPFPAESDVDIDMPDKDIESPDFSTVAHEAILGQDSVGGEDLFDLGTIHQRLDRNGFSQVSTSRTTNDTHAAGVDLNQLHRLTCQRMMKNVLQRNGVKQTPQHSVKPTQASASYNEGEASASQKSTIEPRDVISSCVITGSRMTVQQRPKVSKLKEARKPRLLSGNRKLQKPAPNVRSYHSNMSPPVNQTCMSFPGPAEVVIRASRDYSGDRIESSRNPVYDLHVSRGYQERRSENAGTGDASGRKRPAPIAAPCLVNTPQPPNNTPIWELATDPARANKNSNYSEPDESETQTDIESAEEADMPLYCYQPSPTLCQAECPIRDMEHHPTIQKDEYLDLQANDIVTNDISRITMKTHSESAGCDHKKNTTPSSSVIRDGHASPRNSKLMSYEDNGFIKSRLSSDGEFCPNQETEILRVDDPVFPRDIQEFSVGKIGQDAGVSHHENNKQNVAMDIISQDRNVRPLATHGDRKQIEDVWSEPDSGAYPMAIHSRETLKQTPKRSTPSDQIPTEIPANNFHEANEDVACSEDFRGTLDYKGAVPRHHTVAFTSSERPLRSPSKEAHSNACSVDTPVDAPVTNVANCMKNSSTKESIPKANDNELAQEDFTENGDRPDAATPPTNAAIANNVKCQQLRSHRVSFRRMVREIMSESDEFMSDGDNCGLQQGSNKQISDTVMAANVLGNNHHSNEISELKRHNSTKVELPMRKEDDSSDADSLNSMKGSTFDELKNRALAKAIPFLSRLQIPSGYNRSSTNGCGEEKFPGLTQDVNETKEQKALQDIKGNDTCIHSTNGGNITQNSNKCLASRDHVNPLTTNQSKHLQGSSKFHNSPANVNANKAIFVSTRDHEQEHRRSRIPVRQPAVSKKGIQSKQYELQHEKSGALVDGEQRDDNTLTLILKRKKGGKHNVVAALSLAQEPHPAAGEDNIKMIRLSKKVGVYAKDNKVTVEVREDTSFSSTATTCVETSGGTTVPTAGKLPLAERIKKYQQSRPRNILAGKQRGPSSDPPIVKSADRKASRTQAEWDSSCSDIPSISSSHLDHVSSLHHMNSQSGAENSWTNTAPQTPSPPAEIPIAENKQDKNISNEQQTSSNKKKSPTHTADVIACQSVAQQTSNKTSASLTSGLVATYQLANTKKPVRETSPKKIDSYVCPVEKSVKSAIIQRKLEKGVKNMSTFTKGKTWDVSSSGKHANSNPNASNIPGASNPLAKGPSATFVKKAKEAPKTRQGAREDRQAPVKRHSESSKDVGNLKQAPKVPLKNIPVPVKQKQFYKRLVRPQASVTQPSQAAVTLNTEQLPMIAQCELFSNSSPDQCSDGSHGQNYQDVCPLRKPETNGTGRPQKTATTAREHLKDVPVFLEERKLSYQNQTSEAEHGFGPDCLHVSFNPSNDPAENTKQRLVEMSSSLRVASPGPTSYFDPKATFLVCKPPQKSTVPVPVVDQENNAITHSFCESTDLETISAHLKNKNLKNSFEHEFSCEEQTFTITDKPFIETPTTFRSARVNPLFEKPLTASHATVVLSSVHEQSPADRNTQSPAKSLQMPLHPPRNIETLKRDKISKKPTEKVVINPIPAASSPQSASKHCKTQGYLCQPICVTTDGSNLDVKSNENSNATVCLKACRSESHTPLVCSADRDHPKVARSQREEELDSTALRQRGSGPKSADEYFRSLEKERRCVTIRADEKLHKSLSNLSVCDSAAINPAQPIADDEQHKQELASLPKASEIISGSHVTGCCNSSWKAQNSDSKDLIPNSDHTIGHTKDVDSEINLGDSVTTGVYCEEASLSLLTFQNHTDNPDSRTGPTTPKSSRPRCVGMTTPRKGTITLTQLEQDDFEEYSSSLASSTDSLILSSSRRRNESHHPPQVTRSQDSVTPGDGSRLSGGAEHGEATPSVTPSWKCVDSSRGSSDNFHHNKDLPPLSRRQAGRPHRAVYKRYY